MTFRVTGHRVRMVTGLASTLALLALGCGTSYAAQVPSGAAARVRAAKASPYTAKSPLKIAFMYDSAPNDQGFSQSWNQARLAIQRKFGKRVETTYKVVPDGPQDKTGLESFLSQGYQMIFALSFAQQQYSLKLAQQNPRVTFIQDEVAASKMPKNMGTYYLDPSGPGYVEGMAAAALNKKNPTFGIVGGFPTAADLIPLNAFALGAETINPKSRTHVAWTNDWTSIPLARSAASALASSGAEALQSLTSGPAPAPVAKNKGLLFIGYKVGQRYAAPKQYLTGTVFDWNKYAISQVQAKLTGAWKSSKFYASMANGGMRLDNWGPAYKRIPARTRAKIAATIKKLKSGKLRVFTGPIKDQKGKVLVRRGDAPSEAKLQQMDYLVQGVIGSIPSSN